MEDNFEQVVAAENRARQPDGTLSPEDAKKYADHITAMLDAADSIMEDPESVPAYLSYNEKEDPELNSDEVFTESLKSAVRAFREGGVNGFRLNDEYFRDFFKKHGWTIGPDSYNEFYDSLKGKFTDYGTETNKKFAKNWWDRMVLKYKSNNMLDEDNGPALGEDGKPLPPPDPYEGLSDEDKAFANKYDTWTEGSITARETSDMKYDAIYDACANVITGDSIKKHVFICGDAGVGKTFSTKLCVKQLWDKSPLKREGWTQHYYKGDIGTTVMPIVAFFFEHRNREIMILDDADAFLSAKDERVMNMLKGMLNTENTIMKPEPVFIPATIRKPAVKYLRDAETALTPTREEMKFCEGRVLKIDKEKFNEGVISISCNGKNIYEAKATPEDLEYYRIVETNKFNESKAYKKNSLFGMQRMNEGGLEDLLAGLQGSGIGGGNGDDMDMVQNQEAAGELPEEFCFTSRVIMISNLAPSEVNDAFRSRCDVVPITLTHAEFIAHCEVVIPGLMKDSETKLDPALVEKMKLLMYMYMQRMIALEGKPFMGEIVTINLSLQFRLFAELAGKWLAQAMSYCRKNSISLSVDTFEIVAAAIEARFLKGFLLPTLADNQYAGDTSGRRR